MHRGHVRRLPLRPRRPIWTSAADGVHCYDPDGTLIGKIKIPELVSNVCFAAKAERLFICGTTSLYPLRRGQRSRPEVE